MLLGKLEKRTHLTFKSELLGIPLVDRRRSEPFGYSTICELLKCLFGYWVADEYQLPLSEAHLVLLFDD